MFILLCKSQTAAKILQDVPPLTRGRKIPAGSSCGNRAGRVIIIGSLEGGITVEAFTIGTDMFAIAVAADVFIVIGFRYAFRQALINR